MSETAPMAIKENAEQITGSTVTTSCTKSSNSEVAHTAFSELEYVKTLIYKKTL